MELARTAHLELDISSEAAVLSYTYAGTPPLEVAARVDLGDADRPIAGHGIYALAVYINDVLLSPASQVVVAAGITRTLMVSRAIPLVSGDVIVLSVTGLPADVAVHAAATLRDATPMRRAEVLGAGAILVDHDYGGVDNLALRTADGTRIASASIRAYAAEDYDAGRRSASYVLADTVTDGNGRWVRPLMLDAGPHVLLAYANGRIKTTAKRLTVA